MERHDLGSPLELADQIGVDAVQVPTVYRTSRDWYKVGHLVRWAIIE